MDPSWSRLIRVDQIDGVGRTWHILDSANHHETAEPTPILTLLCVHGNPSWSFLWRQLLAARPARIRVIAVDQLEMGFSERAGTVRRLATRVEDLCHLTSQLHIDGPVVTVAHDWGGPISLGWAQRHIGQIAGIVLLNTAVHQPIGSPAPAVIRAIRSRSILRKATVSTKAFINGAIEMSRPRLDPGVRAGFLAPYETPARRQAIADFVEDIPLDPAHPSNSTLDAIARDLDQLKDLPALLLWGARDKVFSDLYLHDLERRLPRADVHRFAAASHFVSEDANTTPAIYAWLEQRVLRSANSTAPRDASNEPNRSPEPTTLFATFDQLKDTNEPAIIEMGVGHPSITFTQLHHRVVATAAGLRAAAVAPGDRVALMIPPGIDLTVALYGCWRAGAVAVLIDSGLGPRGMSQALASASPQHLIGIPKALVASRTLRWPGQRISTKPLPPSQARALGVTNNLESLSRSTAPLPDLPMRSADAAVVFTSGATGPSKGVCYRHQELEAQRDVLARTYQIQDGDRLVAAFAPFALYGPALGVSSVVPDMNVAAPGTLTASALGDAVATGQATLVFASPAALRNVVQTKGELAPEHRGAFDKVRLLLSAGAPLRPPLLTAAAELFPNATTHTPYGMTEALPTSSISLDEIQKTTTEAGNRTTPESRARGVCVGRPVAKTQVMISGLDPSGVAVGELTDNPNIVGEIVIRAPHLRHGYDRLWLTEHLASRPPGWHRSGDVGVLDEQGRLWVGGRIGHVVTTSSGPITPVGIEQAIEELPDISAAAVVGVGPVGTQQLVAIIETTPATRRAKVANLDQHDQVRLAALLVVEEELCSVLIVPRLPVDRRHNSKIDRTRLAAWAEGVLAGERMSSP